VAPAPTVIAVIDDDVALCDLLASLLSGPGRVVEQVIGATGLTAELLSLSRPRLVLLNPRIRGVELDELRELVLAVRELTGARFILMVGQEDQSANLPRLLGADRAIPIGVLLRDPLRELALTSEPEPRPAVPAQAEARNFSSMSPGDILAMDLGEGGLELDFTPELPAASSASSAVRGSSAAVNLAALIDDELGAPVAPAREHSYDITLDTVSEHNLVVDAWKQVEGVFVSTLFPPALGDRLHLRVSFPWGAIAKVDGVATWVSNESFRRKRNGVGVTVELTADFKILAQRFLSLRQPALRPA